MKCIALERVPLMFVRGTSSGLCSGFLPTVSPKAKCKARPGLPMSLTRDLFPPPALAINAEAEMKQVRQNLRSVGGLLTVGKIKSKLKE